LVSHLMKMLRQVQRWQLLMTNHFGDFACFFAFICRA
jgi:hypothetical protein